VDISKVTDKADNIFIAKSVDDEVSLGPFVCTELALRTLRSVQAGSMSHSSRSLSYK
jgi:hypothetical protein